MKNPIVALLIGIVLGLVVDQLVLKPNLTSKVTLPIEKTTQETNSADLTTFDKIIPLKTGYETQGSLTTGPNIDVYSFDIDKPANIRITLKNLPAEYDFYIYNSDKKTIASSIRKGFQEASSIIHLPEIGKHYIKLFTKPEKPTNQPYTITLTILPFYE